MCVFWAIFYLNKKVELLSDYFSFFKKKDFYYLCLACSNMLPTCAPKQRQNNAKSHLETPHRTVLEILSLKASTEDDLSAAVELLLAFADAGRKFKEILCESKAIKYVSKCLSRVQLHQTRQAARDLLYQLAMGNPSYQAQVRNTMPPVVFC